jgi:hypothetical protein
MEPDELDIPEETTGIDYLLTADYAEVINGKSYIVGGGWDRITPPEFPASIRLGVAVGIRIPYLDTNVPHRVRLVLRSGDGSDLFRLEGDLEAGRPPGSRGDSQLIPLAANAQVTVGAPGLLELLAEVDDRPARRQSIRVVGQGQRRPG